MADNIIQRLENKDMMIFKDHFPGWETIVVAVSILLQ